MRVRPAAVRCLMLVLLVPMIATACSLDAGGSPFGDPLDFSDDTSPLQSIVEWAVVLLEGAGIATILIGAGVATAVFLLRVVRGDFSMNLYHRYREQLGEVILLGLEFLVAADIVGTVAISLNLTSVAALAAIILVRTFLSFTLEVETTGYWPWQRGGQSRTGVRERVRQSDDTIIGGGAIDDTP